MATARSDSEVLNRFHRRFAGIEAHVHDAPTAAPRGLRPTTRLVQRPRSTRVSLLALPIAATLIVLVGAFGLPRLAGLMTGTSPAAGPGGSSDWRLEACFAYQPGLTILEAFEVEHVSDLFSRMETWDRFKIGDGTDERPAYVVRTEGTLTIVQPRVGPFPAHHFEGDDLTCLLVLAPDGTFPEGEAPLFLGPLR
jgi:hypothetical protein